MTVSQRANSVKYKNKVKQKGSDKCHDDSPSINPACSAKMKNLITVETKQNRQNEK